jgi:Flp pilus assembly protein TadG
MKGFNVPEQGHVVNILPPLDINGAGFTSDYFDMGLYSHVDIILTLGVTGAASTITLEESDDNSGSSTSAIAFSYYQEETAAGDTLSDRQSATSSGFATSTNDNVTYVISVDAAELSDGYPYLVLKGTDPSASTLTSAVAVLSGSRYAQENTPTAIT